MDVRKYEIHTLEHPLKNISLEASDLDGQNLLKNISELIYKNKSVSKTNEQIKALINDLLS